MNNEEQIVKSLLEKKQAAEVAVADTPAPEGPQEEQTTEEPAYAPTPSAGMETFELMRVLSVPRELYNDRTTQERMQYIFEWAKSGNQAEPWAAVMQNISYALSSLGLTHRGDTKFDRLYQYAKLDSQRQIINSQMRVV